MDEPLITYVRIGKNLDKSGPGCRELGNLLRKKDNDMDAAAQAFSKACELKDEAGCRIMKELAGKKKGK